MTAYELIACLTDRPCEVCKFHTDQGCCKWSCVFEGKIEELPSAERIVAHIQDFTKYQIDWLTEHNDLELEPKLESWVIRFLKDTADCYKKEYLTSAELIRCKDCKWFNELGCAIRIVDDTDRPNEDDFCSFAERRTE